MTIGLDLAHAEAVGRAEVGTACDEVEMDLGIVVQYLDQIVFGPGVGECCELQRGGTSPLWSLAAKGATKSFPVTCRGSRPTP